VQLSHGGRGGRQKPLKHGKDIVQKGQGQNLREKKKRKNKKKTSIPVQKKRGSFTSDW